MSPTITRVERIPHTAPIKQGGPEVEVELSNGRIARVTQVQVDDPAALQSIIGPFYEPAQFDSPDRRQAAWERFIESQLAKSHMPEAVRPPTEPAKSIRFSVALIESVAIGNGDRPAGTRLCTVTTEPGITRTEALMALRNPHLLKIEELSDEPATATLLG
jgi:hypothetical protein